MIRSTAAGELSISPRYRISLSRPISAIATACFFFGDHQRSLEVMRWGLIPFCAKDEKIGFSTINARAEEVDTKPAFREPFRQRRCLVPVENFYEWQKTGKGKQPYAVGLKRGGLMALAGLWDTWRSSAEERIRSFTIITTPPNQLCAKLHNRMPAVLKPDAWPLWLGEQPAELAKVKALLVPYPSDDMIAWPVSPRVGDVKNNDPGLVEPITLP